MVKLNVHILALIKNDNFNLVQKWGNLLTNLEELSFLLVFAFPNAGIYKEQIIDQIHLTTSMQMKWLLY